MTRRLEASTRSGRSRFGRRVAMLSLALVTTAVAVEGSSSILAANTAKESHIDVRVGPASLVPAVRIKPPAPTPPPAPKPTTPTKAELEIPRDEVRIAFDLTNAERRKIGLAPLVLNTQLTRAAASHANDQRNQPCAIGFLTHTGSDGSNGADRILREGLNISRWAENIACNFTSAEAVMRGWMNSSGHRANILDPRLTHIGIATAFSDDGRAYWVQEFAVLRT